MPDRSCRDGHGRSYLGPRRFATCWALYKYMLNGLMRPACVRAFCFGLVNLSTGGL